MSHVARRGADVVTTDMKHVHVSGHGSAEELKLDALAGAAALLRADPRRVSAAGAARACAERVCAARPQVEVLLAQDGDIIQFDATARRIADKAPTGRVLIDVTRVGEVGDEVLRDRRHIAADGLVVAVVAISRQTGALAGDPELVAAASSSTTRQATRCSTMPPASSPSASRPRASRNAPIRG